MKPDEIKQSDLDELSALMQDRTPSVHLDLTRLQAYCLVAQLQLAFRHPRNRGFPYSVAKRIARHLESLFSSSPGLAELLQRGWRK